ncbi:MAG: DUF1641 domain-containing protein [Planctomycetota bacterium]
MTTVEEVYARLDGLDARLERLERMLAPLGALLAQAPQAIATATDTVDAAAGALVDAGLDPDASARELGLLGRRLAQPEALATLRRLVERLDQVEASLELAAQGPALVATAVDAVDHALARAAARGLEPDRRLYAVGELLEQASSPEVLEALSQALEALQQAPGLAATAADTVDALLGRLNERGIELDERLRNGLRALEHLTHPDLVDVLAHALQQGSLKALFVSTPVFAPESVSVVGCAARALVKTRSAPPREVGAWGAFRALGQPEVRRALGFALTFAEHFGRQLETPLPLEAPCA